VTHRPSYILLGHQALIHTEPVMPGVIHKFFWGWPAHLETILEKRGSSIAASEIARARVSGRALPLKAAEVATRPLTLECGPSSYQALGSEPLCVQANSRLLGFSDWRRRESNPLRVVRNL
jgi:hypothetical protein